jgi:hypothetical protein
MTWKFITENELLHIIQKVKIASKIAAKVSGPYKFRDLIKNAMQISLQFPVRAISIAMQI